MVKLTKKNKEILKEVQQVRSSQNPLALYESGFSVPPNYTVH